VREGDGKWDAGLLCDLFAFGEGVSRKCACKIENRGFWPPMVGLRMNG
jgi:hypothetical protein